MHPECILRVVTSSRRRSAIMEQAHQGTHQGIHHDVHHNSCPTTSAPPPQSSSPPPPQNNPPPPPQNNPPPCDPGDAHHGALVSADATAGPNGIDFGASALGID